jgi:hypothetical protein
MGERAGLKAFCIKNAQKVIPILPVNSTSGWGGND